ncbi:MAG: DNA mismatch repair endonuclease MutL [Planctomycetaceae bacterium]
MSRIQQLDAHVINRIAAGEVIERPASVVKELLENSIDALSTRIDIDISGGGVDLIRISDNGEGMHPDDLELAVTSHATSKIRSDADLSHVATLGFRGEALASIASVSRFRIRSRRRGLSVGKELEAEGGTVSILRDCGCPEGTVLEVHNLFFNTPARRKFLKKASTEFGRISDQFARIGLAHPNLHLTLRHNDRLVYELPATVNQVDRIRRFFGAEVADKLIAVESETVSDSGSPVRLWGFVGNPSLSKATRSDQYLFLNGRYIQDRSLQHALGEAYRGLLMVGRHPVSFLFLEVPPDLVDVNVHPTKTEVRFQNSQALYRLLLHTVRDQFRLLDFQPEIQVPGDRSNSSSPSVSNYAVQKELDVWSRSATSGHRPPLIPIPVRDQGSSNTATLPRPADAIVRPNLKSSVFRPAVAEAMSAVIDAPERPQSDSASVEGADVAEMRETDTPAVENLLHDGSPMFAAEEVSRDTSEQPLEHRAFQLYDCYLVVAGDAGLEVIDQHALHERILYEYLRNRILAGHIESQKLLLPESIECSAAEAAVLLEYQDLLQEIGFEISDFGGTSILVSAHPVLLPRGNFVKILRDLAAQLSDSDGKTSRRDLLDRMLHTMACRAAIKAGQRLTQEEMHELLEQRHTVQDAHHCPHGRPTSLILSRATLDKQFGRLG